MFLPSALFLFYWLVGLGPESGGYGGPPWQLGVRASGDLLRRAAVVLILSDIN